MNGYNASTTIGLYIIAHGSPGTLISAGRLNLVGSLLKDLIDKTGPNGIKLRKVCLLVCKAGLEGERSGTMLLQTLCQRLSHTITNKDHAHGLMIAAYESYITVNMDQVRSTSSTQSLPPLNASAKKSLNKVQKVVVSGGDVGPGLVNLLKKKDVVQGFQKYSDNKIIYKYDSTLDYWVLVNVQEYSDKEALRLAPQLSSNARKPASFQGAEPPSAPDSDPEFGGLPWFPELMRVGANGFVEMIPENERVNTDREVIPTL